MPIIVFIRDSQYGMPIAQSVHLVGLTALLATVLILNLRLAGVALKDSSLDWLSAQLKPWMIGGLAVVVLSGALIFIGTPAKYLASNPFRVKIAVLVLNLRLAGVALKDSSLDWLAQQLRPWMLGGLAVVVLSGALIFVGTPAKYLASNPFRVKIAVLVLAMLFQFGTLRRFAAPGSAPGSRAVCLLVAALSLTLWFTVGWAGRAIAFIP